MPRTPISEIFLYVQDHQQKTYVPAGVLKLDGKGRYQFGYAARSWLANPQAFALDPLNLPLGDQIFQSDYLWACFEDAMPDHWGQRVILSLHSTRPMNRLEWLLAARGTGVGMLAASASRHHPPRFASTARFDDLEQLMLATQEIQQGVFDSSLHPPELLQLLQVGSSMGGARPKVTVAMDGREWIAKFSRLDDVFDQVKAEQACLEMARSAGCRVPEVLLKQVGGREVMMIERFDRLPDGVRLHYLSANALLNLHRIRPDDPLLSYQHLSAQIQKISATTQQDQQELFRRMVINIMLGNTDDHLKNHGFLRGLKGKYQLSPLFDVLPHPAQLDMLALGAGVDGRAATLENALSQCQAFGLDRAEAVEVMVEVARVVADCESYFQAAGMSAVDCRMLTGICHRTLPELEPLIRIN